MVILLKAKITCLDFIPNQGVSARRMLSVQQVRDHSSTDATLS